MKFGLKDKHISAIHFLFRQYESIDRVWVYGSRAKGNYKAGSDIDLAIEGKGLSFSEQMRLENELDDLLLPYKIDLSQLCKISNPGLLKHILRVGKLFKKKLSSLPPKNFLLLSLFLWPSLGAKNKLYSIKLNPCIRFFFKKRFKNQETPECPQKIRLPKKVIPLV